MLKSLLILKKEKILQWYNLLTYIWILNTKSVHQLSATGLCAAEREMDSPKILQNRLVLTVAWLLVMLLLLCFIS